VDGGLGPVDVAEFANVPTIGLGQTEPFRCTEGLALCGSYFSFICEPFNSFRYVTTNALRAFKSRGIF